MKLLLKFILLIACGAAFSQGVQPETKTGSVVVGSPTGGNTGVGTVNATGININGVPISAGGPSAVTGSNGVTAVTTSGTTNVSLSPIAGGNYLCNITGASSAPAGLCNYTTTVVTDYSGVDNTGATFSTAGINDAISGMNARAAKRLYFPGGTYAVTPTSSGVAIFDFNGVTGISIECESRDTAHIVVYDPFGTSNVFNFRNHSGGVTFRNCDVHHMIAGSTLAGVTAVATTAGTLVNNIDGYYFRWEDNGFGGTNDWDKMAASCSSVGVSQLYISGNQVFDALHDGIDLSCASSSFAVGDVYIEPGDGQRNYITGSANAGIDQQGNISGVFIIDNTICCGNAYGLLGNSNSIAAGLGSETIYGNDIDSNTTAGAFFSGLVSTRFQMNHLFQSGTNNVICTNCQNISANGNHYEGTAPGLILNGVNAWSDAGSHWGGGNLPVTIGPNGSTPSSIVSISDAQYANGTGPFVTWGSGATTAYANISVNLGPGTSCQSGTNVATPTILCTGNGTQQFLLGINAIQNTGDIADFSNNTNGGTSIAVVNQNSGSSAFARVYFNNNSGQEAFLQLAGGGNGTPNNFNIFAVGPMTVQTANVSTAATSAQNINITPGNGTGTGASNGGSIVLNPGSSTNGSAGSVQISKSSIVSIGTKFTTTVCTNGTTVGGATAGEYIITGVSNNCVVALPTTTTAYSCSVGDTTTLADTQVMSASNTNSATFAGTTVTGDKIKFSCTAGAY